MQRNVYQLFPPVAWSGALTGAFNSLQACLLVVGETGARMENHLTQGENMPTPHRKGASCCEASVTELIRDQVEVAGDGVS